MQRIKEMPENMLNEFRKRIFLYAKMVGIKVPLTVLEVDIIYNFLMKEFSDLGMDEITDALEMAASKQFEIDPEHYQSFNIVYLGKILDAYRTYRAEEIRKHRIHTEGEERKAEDKAEEKRLPNTASDYQKLCYDCLIEDVRRHKKVPMGARWEEAYLYLEKTGKITLTNEEKDMYAKNVKANLKAEYIGQKSSLNRILNSKILFRRECRTQYLKQYLQANLKSYLDGS